MRILSLEASTSSAKAMLYDLDRVESRIETEAFPTQINRPDGTQDAEAVFKLTVEAGRRVCDGKAVDLIALGGAWHSVLLCDRNMHPVTPVYSWASTHANGICRRLRGNASYVNHYYQQTGCMVNAIYPYFKLLYMREQGFCLKDYYILGQGSYITFRLTGHRAVSDCMASGSGLMNIHSRRYDADLLDTLDVGEECLSPIHRYTETVPLDAEGAALLGLRPGIPVIPACSDGGMNQIAIGGYRMGAMSFSVGTSAAIRLSTQRPVLPDHPATWCYLSPVGYMSGAATSGACNCISWYKNAFLSGVEFEQIEKSFGTVGDTPVFLPFLFGERCPGWDDARRGALAMLKPDHGPMEVYQAICEGILFNVYQCYQRLIAENPVDPRIILSGGVLNSPGWTQMCADIFGHTMEIPENQQSSLWGGVVLGAMLLRGEEMADRLLGCYRAITPDLSRHAAYMRKYQTYLHQYEHSAHT